MAAAVRLWEVKQNTEEKNFYDGLLVNIFGDKTMLGPGFQIASHYAWIPSLIICQNYLHIPEANVKLDCKEQIPALHLIHRVPWISP